MRHGDGTNNLYSFHIFFVLWFVTGGSGGIPPKVTETSISSPWRKIRTFITSPPECLPINELKLYSSLIFVPSKERITSFSTIPALSAGEPGITARSVLSAPHEIKTP